MHLYSSCSTLTAVCACSLKGVRTQCHAAKSPLGFSPLHHRRHAAQALRLDGFAAAGMVNSSLAGVASMGRQLRQMAILGLQHISDGCLMAALAQLPLLQVGV